MKKAAILAMFATALYFVLKAWYSQPGNSGIPNPRAMVGPVYLYAILALIADFMGGFPIMIAAGLTVAMIWHAKSNNYSAINTVKTPGTQQPQGGITPPAGNSSSLKKVFPKG